MGSDSAKAGGLLAFILLVMGAIAGSTDPTSITDMENGSFTLPSNSSLLDSINNTNNGEEYYLSENLAPLTSWSVSGDGYTPDTWSPTYYDDTIELHFGNASIRNEASAPWENRESNRVGNIPVIPGEVYLLTGYIKTSTSNLGTTTVPAQNGARFGIDFYGSPYAASSVGHINGLSYDPNGSIPEFSVLGYAGTNSSIAANYVNWNNSWTYRIIRFKVPSLIISQWDGQMYKPTNIKPWFGVWGSGDGYNPKLETEDVWFSDTRFVRETNVPPTPTDPLVIPPPALYVTVTWLNSTGGSIYPTGVGYSSISYLSGTTINFTAYPNLPLYSFSHWLVNGNVLSPVENPESLLLAGTDNYTIQPVFTYTAPPPPTGVDWTLTVFGSPGGTTSPTPASLGGLTDLTQEVTAIPHAGYRFSFWILDSTSTRIETNPYTVTSALGETHTLEPFFTLDVQGEQSEVLIIPTGTPEVYGDTGLDELMSIVGDVNVDLDDVLSDLEIDF